VTIKEGSYQNPYDAPVASRNGLGEEGLPMARIGGRKLKESGPASHSTSPGPIKQVSDSVLSKEEGRGG